MGVIVLPGLLMLAKLFVGGAAIAAMEVWVTNEYTVRPKWVTPARLVICLLMGWWFTTELKWSVIALGG